MESQQSDFIRRITAPHEAGEPEPAPSPGSPADESSAVPRKATNIRSAISVICAIPAFRPQQPDEVAFPAPSTASFADRSFSSHIALLLLVQVVSADESSAAYDFDGMKERRELMAVVDLFSGFTKLMTGLEVEPDEKPWYG